LGTPYKSTTYSNVSGFFMPVRNIYGTRLDIFRVNISLFYCFGWFNIKTVNFVGAYE